MALTPRQHAPTDFALAGTAGCRELSAERKYDYGRATEELDGDAENSQRMFAQTGASLPRKLAEQGLDLEAWRNRAQAAELVRPVKDVVYAHFLGYVHKPGRIV
jgi:hypothetical protein